VEQRGQFCVKEQVTEGGGNVRREGVTVSAVFLGEDRGDYVKKHTY
jgi:hypothetical protein